MTATHYRRVSVDGEAVLLPNDPAPAPKNPPLSALNDAYRADDAERRGEVSDAVEKINGALQTAFLPSGKKRVQKPLRSPL